MSDRAPDSPSSRHAPPSSAARSGLLLGAIGAASVCTIVEHDTPWYLRAGLEILAQRRLPAVDPFSYTSHKPWLNHEWLTEVVLALVYRGGGLVGIGLLQGLALALAIAALIYARPEEKGVPRLSGLAPLAFAVAAMLLRETVAPRAQLLSTPLFALTFALALRECSAPSRRLWLVAPLFFVWTQLHGSYPNGVILLGALFLAAPSLRHALAVAAAALLTCAGPYGFAVHEHYLGARTMLGAIREFQPLHVALAHGAGAAWGFVALDLAAATALVARRRGGERVRFEAVALAVFTLGAIYYVRLSTEASLVAASALAPALARWPRSLATRRGARLGLAAALSAIALAVTLSARTLGFGFDRSRFPVAAVDFLRRTHPTGPMFNSYNFGGYLIYAWPEEKVYIDGRMYTVYSEEHIREFLALYDDPTRFRSLEARLGLRLAVLQRRGRGAALLDWLRREPGWRVIYEDELAAVLTRDAGS